MRVGRMSGLEGAMRSTNLPFSVLGRLWGYNRLPVSVRLPL